MKNPSVIIIGAGASGIAAATKLLENSIDDITILEAEYRIGGRILSVKFEDTFVDLGAEFVHGEKDNIVHSLAKDLDVLEPGVIAFEEKIYYSDGSQLQCEFLEKLENLVEDYENLGDRSEDQNITKSVGEVFMEKYNSALVNEYRNDGNLEKILKEAPIFAEGQIIMAEGTYSWLDSSAKSDYVVCEGEQFMVWKKVGYKTILDILMKTHLDSRIKYAVDKKLKLRSTVQKIFWNQDKTVTVVTSDNVTYSADYVIFTLSLGVLKKYHTVMFDPPLPLSKQEAIEKIGFGGVMKIAVSFSKKWWHDDDRAFSFFWSDEDLGFLQEETKFWVSNFRDFSKIPHNSNVWLGWFAGDLVPEIEKLPLEIMKSGINYVLQKFLGKNYSISAIDKIVPTTWCSNENFLGTYSYVKTGTYSGSFSYQTKLTEPLKNGCGKPTVFFAGEATHRYYHATVHGAIESGFREAERIVSLSHNC